MRYDVMFKNANNDKVEVNTVFTDMDEEYVKNWYKKQSHVEELMLVRESDNDGIANMVVRL